VATNRQKENKIMEEFRNGNANKATPMSLVEKTTAKSQMQKTDIQTEVDAFAEYASEWVDYDGKRRKFVINEKGKKVVFPVTVEPRTLRRDPQDCFVVQLHPNGNFPKIYPVDEDNKLFVKVLDKDEKLLAKLFTGETTGEDGRTFTYLGLEVKDRDGAKVQYNIFANGKQINGFWFSSGDRKALKRMGYLDIVEI
jgi:hypothetical protein